MVYRIFTTLYTITLICLSIYGLQALVMSALFLVKWKRNPPKPPEPKDWPTVTVQLPVYNEQHVIERLIKAACQLDYPTDKLSIQVLDDSTDETTTVAAHMVRRYRLQGINISLLHRDDRTGFKAGALSAALPLAQGELIAILDADFIPSRKFLRKLVPHLAANSQLGMVQARWGHLNADYNLVTRGEALYLDGHFVIEQTARSRSGLLFNFNGSGGIWRKTCIVDAGGWQADTLAEDLDLSYRAEIKGWKVAYLPDVVVPGEIPPQVTAFKKQQYRWSRGAIQVLRKNAGRLIRDGNLSTGQRLMGLLHLSGNITSPLMLIFIISCLPVILNGGKGLPYLPWLFVAGLGGPVLLALSQVSIYRNWPLRLLNLPILIFMGIGLAFNNSRAVLAGFGKKLGIFERTPKFHIETNQDPWQGKMYSLHLDTNILGEIIFGAYSAVCLSLAIHDLPTLVPMLAVFTLSFTYVSLTGIYQAWQSRPRSVTDTKQAEC